MTGAGGHWSACGCGCLWSSGGSTGLTELAAGRGLALGLVGLCGCALTGGCARAPL